MVDMSFSRFSCVAADIFIHLSLLFLFFLITGFLNISAPFSMSGDGVRLLLGTRCCSLAPRRKSAILYSGLKMVL